MNEYPLFPRYDARASFYGKAKVTDRQDGTVELRSYGTLVARVIIPSDSPENTTAEVYGWYSNTTGRHIKEFLKQYGFKATNKDQILKDYYKENDDE